MHDQLERERTLDTDTRPQAAPPLARYSRRLSDKIMTAFTHAYAIGAVDVAERLRAILADVERKRIVNSRRENRAPMAVPVMDQTARWIEFVDARNHYRRTVEDPATRGAEQRAALTAMKDAYRRWSEV